MQTALENNITQRRVDIDGAADAIDTKSLGGRMAFARMRKKITQKELAERIKNKDGSSKSRATIVQYERDNIMPPLDVVELIAKQLGVSASYIAFGEHVVDGIHKQDVEMISFPEISFGRDGDYVSSAMALSKDTVASFGVSRDDIKAYVMPHDAPAFDIFTDDRLIVDSSIDQPAINGGMYVLKTQSGMELIRVDPHFGAGARAKEVTFTGPKGQVLKAKTTELHFLGAVVFTLRRSK